MKKRILIILLAAMTAATVIGCSVQSTGVKVYGKQDDHITVNEGEEFTIKLDENPTTGYQWSYVISNENVVELSGDDYTPDSKDEDLVGSGGKRLLTFKAVSKGNAVISMVYEQSWEKNENDEKLEFQIEVK